MSYFFCTSKLHLLSHQIENISLATIISSTNLSLLEISNIINEHKREYIVIPTIGAYLYIQNKNNLTYHFTGKNITGKIFNQNRIQKREV